MLLIHLARCVLGKAVRQRRILNILQHVRPSSQLQPSRQDAEHLDPAQRRSAARAVAGVGAGEGGAAQLGAAGANADPDARTVVGYLDSPWLTSMACRGSSSASAAMRPRLRMCARRKRQKWRLRQARLISAVRGSVHQQREDGPLPDTHCLQSAAGSSISAATSSACDASTACDAPCTATVRLEPARCAMNASSCGAMALSAVP